MSIDGDSIAMTIESLALLNDGVSIALTIESLALPNDGVSIPMTIESLALLNDWCQHSNESIDVLSNRVPSNVK